MNQSNAGDPGKEAKLPRRDWIVLPMLSLLTICTMAVSLELIGTYMFPRAGTGLLNCLVLNDPSTGVRGIPNTVCRHKIPEGQLVEYRFNGCGHRTGMECGAKPPGTYRIVTPGSSFVLGYGIADENTFTSLLPERLSQEVGRQIDLYNEGIDWGYPHTVALQFDQVLAAQPDMILWVLTPSDIKYASVVLPDLGPQGADKDASPIGKSHNLRTIALDRIKAALANKSIPEAASAIFDQTRISFLLEHFLYLSQSQYVKSYLMAGDDEGFLRAELDTQWQNRLRKFDSDAAQIEGEAASAGVPLVAVLVPNRAQAAMISTGQWAQGIDPYKLDAELRSIIRNHGGTYIDILPAFRDIPNAEQSYFPVDGHPNARGHALISQMLAKALAGGAVPRPRSAVPPPEADGGSR